MSKLIQKAKKCFAMCTVPDNSTFCSTSTDEATLLSEKPRNTNANVSPAKFIHNELIYEVNKTPVKINRDFNLKKQSAKTNLLNKYTSELDLPQLTMDVSEFPMLVVTPEKPKCKILTSTLNYSNDFSQNEFTVEDSPSLTCINEHDEYQQGEFVPLAFANLLYESPVQRTDRTVNSLITNDWSANEFLKSKYFTMDISQEDSCDVQSYGFDLGDFATAQSGMFSSVNSHVSYDSDLFVCCVSYEAMSPNELTVEFSERLKLVQNNSDNHLCLVQNIQTGVYGFIPKYCVVPVSMFLRNVQRVRMY
jgi:hypothetical protein